jgi:lysozyme family protein
MKDNFDYCLSVVLASEGGFTDHPSDPGGATKYGITWAVLAGWRLPKKTTKDDVRALTTEEASAIYKAKYWDAIRGDELPNGVDLMAFDCAVNQGTGRAVRFLQQAVDVQLDGQLGPVTMAAVNSAFIPGLIIEYGARRMNAYGMLSRLFQVFGLGWSRRLMTVHRASLRMLYQRGAVSA